MRRQVVIALVCAACMACTGRSRHERPAKEEARAAAPPLAAPAGPPRLVVLIVVDQLPSWRFEVDLPYLEDGFARLIAEGAYYPSAEFPYAATYTAPGHAAIATGAGPDVTGILGNTWYERSERAAISAVDDAASPVFYVHGKPPPGYVPERSSGHRLLVDGIGDVLTAHTGGRGKSVAVGLKDRGAIVVLGRKPTLAIWYDEGQPAMTTSPYYTAELPAWLRALPPVSDRFGFVWEPRDPLRLARLSGGEDLGAGEGENEGLDTSFPHAIAECEAPAKALRSTPVGTDLVFDTARAAIAGEQLGADDIPDVLAISLSSHDYAGHDWGQESWERIELLFALDRSLGEFLRDLDEQFGDRYAVVLTSDHGAVPMIERSRQAGRPAVRVPTATLVDTAQKAAQRVLGPGDWAANYSASTLYMTDAFLAQPAARRDRALDDIAQAVARIEGVGYVRRADQIAGRCDGRSGDEALACRSLHPPRSGELFVAPARYCLISAEWTTGTGHGTPSDEDRFVPVIVRGPGFRPGRRSRPVSMLQVAPTVAALLQIPPPPAAREKPLE